MDRCDITTGWKFHLQFTLGRKAWKTESFTPKTRETFQLLHRANEWFPGQIQKPTTVNFQCEFLIWFRLPRLLFKLCCAWKIKINCHGSRSRLQSLHIHVRPYIPARLMGISGASSIHAPARPTSIFTDFMILAVPPKSWLRILLPERVYLSIWNADGSIKSFFNCCWFDSIQQIDEAP